MYVEYLIGLSVHTIYCKVYLKLVAGLTLAQTWHLTIEAILCTRSPLVQLRQRTRCSSSHTPTARSIRTDEGRFSPSLALLPAEFSCPRNVTTSPVHRSGTARHAAVYWSSMLAAPLQGGGIGGSIGPGGGGGRPLRGLGGGGRVCGGVLWGSRTCSSSKYL